MRTLAAFLLACFCFGGPAFAKPIEAAAASLPVQEGGRIKPLAAYARAALVQLSGRSSLPGDQNLTAMRWLIECLRDPAAARERRVFLIERPEIMNALRLEHKGARERFSYEAIAPARAQLAMLARPSTQAAEQRLSPLQEEMLRLAENTLLFERLLTLGEILRFEYDGAALSDLAQSRRHAQIDPAALLLVSRLVESTGLPAFIPPAARESEAWLTPSQLWEQSAGHAPAPIQIQALAAFEALARSDGPGLAEQMAAVYPAVMAAMPSRALRMVSLEVLLLRLDPFFWALLHYLVSFLFFAGGWLFPRTRLAARAGFVLLAAGFIVQAGGVALRSFIRGQPPVSTLYETILFVGAVGVLLCILLERLSRVHIAAPVGALLGALGLFLAGRYELVARGDTMPSLVAVLNSNFWLATHVTTVTIGYGAGLVAGAVAHVYLLGNALGLRRPDQAFYRDLTRMVYGILCFTLVFSIVGTILGGIWASQSWGRFWGWDPKENGALMIILWILALLHARLAGHIREFGLHMGAVAGAIIVAFSWFGVNQLGVGLHSYGFTTGVQRALVAFYAVESLVLLLGVIGWARRPAPSMEGSP